MNKNPITQTLMSIAGQKDVITVHKAFVNFTGYLESAMMLSQLLYWTPRSSNNGWIAKSDKDFQEELCLSRYSVRKAVFVLEKMGIMGVETRMFNRSPTKHYKINLDELDRQWTVWIQTVHCLKSNSGLSEIEQSLTETTTKNTTETLYTDDDLDNYEEEKLSDNSHELSPAIAEQKILFSFGEKNNGNDARLNTQSVTKNKPPKSSKSGELSPTTPGGSLLFAKLANEMRAKGRKPAVGFASIAQRDAFLEVEERLTINQLEQAIDNALRNEITARRNIINYLSKYKARSVHAPALGYRHTTIVNEDGSVYF